MVRRAYRTARTLGCCLESVCATELARSSLATETSLAAEAARGRDGLLVHQASRGRLEDVTLKGVRMGVGKGREERRDPGVLAQSRLDFIRSPTYQN